ncbi:response regulator transcription factor [Bordetella sputigena]|uniref:response regulator n=1 Tax=Bordetella sputigena TaxID=1416810 RepID=UPI0039EFB900
MQYPRSCIRVAILDDHVIVRHGLVSCLATESDIVVVGSYESSFAMIAGLAATPADVLLVDYSLGPEQIDGVSLIRALKAKFAKSRIIILSSHYDPAIVALAMRVGADGFVGKNQSVDHIAKAIRAVAAGGRYLSPDMAYRLEDASVRCVDRDREVPAPHPEDDAVLLAGVPLSVKEREVIRCFLDGMSVTQIAGKFNRSKKTISTQKQTAFRKLGVTSDGELFKIKHMLGEL